MRKTVLALVAATALTVGSAASAAITVSGSTGLNNPDPAASASVQTVGNTTTINFGQNPLGDAGTFLASFILHNDTAGVYNIKLSTSDPNSFFDSADFAGQALSPYPDNQTLKLIPSLTLGIGDYIFNLTGHNTKNGGSFTGNLTISAVPEASTWAMMLIGFGAIGFTMRNRRRTALAQIA